MTDPKAFGAQYWIIVEITISLPSRKQLLSSWAKAKWNFQWHYHSKRLLWAKQICSLWVFKLWTESENKNLISLATLLSPWCHTNQLSPVAICSSQDGIWEILLYTWHNQPQSSSPSPQEWHMWLCLTDECWPRALLMPPALTAHLEKVRVGKSSKKGGIWGLE